MITQQRLAGEVTAPDETDGKCAPRTPEDVALLTIRLFDACEHFTQVAGEHEDGQTVITFECDGKRYEAYVSPISPALEAEVYGS